jgi:hypothetical protein
MIGLALCMLLRRETDSALVAAFAAVGVGFGGQETYGQTVQISGIPETWAWGMIGFTIKGAVWGLLGGAAIGIALTRERFRSSQLIAGFALMVLGTYAGWKLINQPKLIYFSYRLDKPREELWAGLLLGGILLLAWLSWQAGARLPWRFALWGALGGGLGFGLGAAIHIWGRARWPDFPFDWWKTMEFTFGALLGLAFGYCAWRHQNELAPPQPVSPEPTALPKALALAGAGILVGIVIPEYLPTRLEYTIAGALLLAAALFSPTFCRQTAITVTYCAYALDFLKNRHDLPAAALWTFVLVTTVATVAFTARNTRMRPQFLFLTLTAVAVALLKGFLWLPAAPGTQHITTELTFVALAVLVVLWTRRFNS